MHRYRIRRLFVPGCLLALACAALPAGEAAPDAETRQLFSEYLAEGAAALRRAHQNGWARYEPNLTYVAIADGRVRAALKLRPTSAEVYFWSGLILFDYGDYREAASRARSAVELRDDLPRAWHLWGQSLLFLGRWEEAQQKLERAIRLYPETHPERPLVFFNLGRCYYHGFGETAAARRFFMKAIELREAMPGAPDFPEARFYSGLCLLARGDPALGPLAVRAFREVYEAGHRDAETTLRLALAYRLEGRYDQAERFLLAVLQAEPNHYEAHLHLAHLYLTDLPDLVQARHHAEQFLADSPHDHPWRDPIMTLLLAKEEAAGVRE